MDNRWAKRELIVREVRIFCGMPTLSGSSVDVSLSGIFVTLPPGPLIFDKVVQLVVAQRGIRITVIQPLPAVVTRYSEKGFGMMYAALDPDAIIRFLALLRASRSFLMLRTTRTLASFRPTRRI